VVSPAQFTLAASEREIFEAQIRLESGDVKDAMAIAYGAMVRGAEALVKTQNYNVPTDEQSILAEFRRLFCDTQMFYDKYAGSTFADYLFKACDAKNHVNIESGTAIQRLQEAQLFIDAAHSCYNKLAGAAGAVALSGAAEARGA
jgi:sulfite reductase (ferredoxin)